VSKPWNCPKCGPVKDALYGEDAEFHCSSLDCDRVVRILTREELRGGEKWTARSTLSQGEKAKRAKAARIENAEKARAAKADADRGRKILAGMRARNKRRGRARPAKAAAAEPGSTASKGTGGNGVGKKTAKKSSRVGRCRWCDEDKWLLKNDPPSCPACWHARNDRDRPANKKARKRRAKPEASPPKRRKRRAKPEAVEVVDEIEREGAAIVSCGRALEGLSRDAMERVLWNVAHRFREDLGINPAGPRLLLGDDDA